MSTEELKSPPPVPRKELPPTYIRNGPTAEWEAPPEEPQNKSPFKVGMIASAGTTISDQFNRIFPPYKTYFGRSRRVLFICLGVLFIVLLGLIIGLAVGLGHKKTAYERYLANP
jgi:hypothetical protein